MTKNTKRVTLAQVSKKADVSLNTAAKVLAGQTKKARISEKTAKKVRNVASKLGYVPNIMAKNLRAQKTGMIGVFIADMSDSIYVRSSHVILQELHNKGFSPLLTVAEIGLELCKKEWIQNNIEGLILCGTTKEINSEFLEEINRLGILLVITGCAYHDPNNNTLLNPNISIVSVDNKAGIQLAFNHIKEKTKKTKIAFIAGPKWHADDYERKTAYIETIQDIHKPIIIETPNEDINWRRGYQSAIQIYNDYKDVNAIIAYDDQIAIGAIKWFTENKIKIPEDIKIIGFDNSPEAEFCTPSLTSISLPLDAIGRKAVDILESSLYSKNPAEKIQINPSLVERDSLK